MNRKTITLIIAFFMFLNLANAQVVDHTFNYQGELLDNNVAITDTFNFTVQAYSDSLGTIPIGDLAEYKDANAVLVTKGFFNLKNVDLGFATYDGMDIWLQISVKKPADVNYTALTPLQKMQSVPYATTLIDKGATQGQVLTFNDATGWQPADSRQQITTDNGTASSPVCFNASGELFPCSVDYLTPNTATLIGTWTGQKIYNRNSIGSCFDDEVTLQILPWSSNIPKLNSLTTRRVNGPISIHEYSSLEQIEAGLITAVYNPYGSSTIYTISFNSLGEASGEWSDPSCFGTWSFTKDP